MPVHIACLQTWATNNDLREQPAVRAWELLKPCLPGVRKPSPRSDRTVHNGAQESSEVAEMRGRHPVRERKLYPLSRYSKTVAGLYG